MPCNPSSHRQPLPGVKDRNRLPIGVVLGSVAAALGLWITIARFEGLAPGVHAAAGALIGGICALALSPPARRGRRVEQLSTWLEQALEAAQLGRWEWDLGAGPPHVDRRWLAHLGLADDDRPASIEALRARVHPEDLPDMDIAVGAVIEGRAPRWRMVLRMRHRDGDWRWIETTGTAAERGADGRARRLVGTHADVTAEVLARRDLAAERDRAEAALADLAEYRRAIDAHTIFVRTDERGVIREVNRRFCEISGYGPEELIGRTHAVVNSGAHPEAFWREMWRTLGAGEAWRGEICNRAKDGSLYWVDTTILPSFDREGRCRGYLGVRNDVTAHKRAEQRLEGTLDALPDLLFEVDGEGRILDYRASREEQLYSRPTAFLGRRVNEVLPSEPAVA